MKTISFLVLCILVMRFAAISQVKIGDNSTTVSTASLLELETTNKGFVLPRISITSVNSSAPLAAGLLTGTIVYNTNSGITGGSGAAYITGMEANGIFLPIQLLQAIIGRLMVTAVPAHLQIL